MNIALWIEEGFEEIEAEASKKSIEKNKNKTVPGCDCGRAVCCGKHKKGQCSCGQNQKERE